MAPATALALAASLFALSAHAASPLSGGAVLLRAEDVLSRPYATLMSSTILHSRAEENQTASEENTDGDGIGVNDDGSLNITAWNTITNTACQRALSQLVQSTNPSGACVCYNLPSLDTETGVFEADLRLYKVSNSRGDFSSIAPEDVTVGLSYVGASVMPVSEDEVSAAGMVGTLSSVAKRAAGLPELMQTYMFVGQIDQDRMETNMSMAAFEALILPTLTLTGTNSSGIEVQTNVSINEASFLTGVFSNEMVLSDFGAAQAAVDEQIAGLKNGTVAFVLPGIQLMVYPIGLIITGVWLLVGCAAVGFGTYERWKYAEMYRRRQAVLIPRKTTI
ncbi:hypothetical protein B0J13DRAFT_36747 [Dactylonectria estremocensis]|uniref:Uncharacterized protein n=1 Tax=Dactylonectria estremocensis TaxID=1079267 RepID=A0A9P9FL19_9HYPO|nr:hypothetical protein B0J13DRAFT_36747 [Dactylonectria estremocensis]